MLCKGAMLVARGCQVLQVFGGDKGKTRRVHNLQSDVAALEAALEAAQAEYDKVMDRNLKVGEAAGCPQNFRDAVKTLLLQSVSLTQHRRC